MNYEIIELEEKIIEGVGIRTTNQEKKAVQDIGDTWKKFFTEGTYQTIENKINNKTIGLYTDYESDFTGYYNFIAGVQVSKQHKEKKNTILKIIPKGKYAKFLIKGDIQAVQDVWDKIWNMDLKRKYTCDFEEYQNSTENMQEQEIHIYIAIQ